MMERSETLAATVVLCVVAFAATSGVHAQVYKCQDANGKTVYADAPCASGGTPLRLQDATKQGAANPTACTQLLDETRRLAADAERDAQRGKHGERRQLEAPEIARGRVSAPLRGHSEVTAIGSENGLGVGAAYSCSAVALASNRKPLYCRREVDRAQYLLARFDGGDARPGPGCGQRLHPTRSGVPGLIA